MLLPLTPLYRAVVVGRALGFQYRLLRSHQLPVPVISVGNLTFGGTGKTPVTISLVQDLIGRGRRPAILTRGYRRQSDQPLVIRGPNHGFDATTAGDEPIEMALRLPETMIIVDKDRVQGGRTAIGLGADTLVLDDGFQHLFLKRDVDLVLIDTNDPWGGERLPPLGRLREPLSALARASAVVVTKLHDDNGKRFDEISASVRRIQPEMPIMGCHLQPHQVRIKGRFESLRRLHGAHVLAFAGLGRPEGFITMLEQAGATIREHVFFDDHHAYSKRDEERLRTRADEIGCVAVTTAKDAVKLSPSFDPWVVEVEMTPSTGKWDLVWNLIEMSER